MSMIDELRERVLAPPSPGQWSLVHDKPLARVRIGWAGTQGGKTNIACRMLAAMAFKNHHQRYMVMAPSFKLLSQATQLMLDEVFEARCPGWIVHKDDHVKHAWRDRNDNVFFFRTSNKPDKQARGSTLHAALFDEAAMESKAQPYRILRERLHINKGPLIITTTPKPHVWLRTELMLPAERGDPNYHLVRWRSVDNPKFDSAEYEEAKLYGDPRWVAQEYDAELVDWGGLVFPIWNPDHHLDDWEWRPDLPVYLSIDFGIANPCVVGFWQVEPKKGTQGHHHMFDEIHRRGLAFPDIWEMCKAKPYFDFKKGRKPRWVTIDPTGSYREKGTGHGLHRFIQRDGVAVLMEDDWNTEQIRQAGIAGVYMALNKQEMSFHRTRTRNVQRAFTLYSRAATDEDGRQSEKPLKDGVSDHCMEQIFYYWNKRPRVRWIDPNENKLRSLHAVSDFEERESGTGM